MTLAEFKRNVSRRTPAAGLSPALMGLWLAGKDKSDQAHTVVMDDTGKDWARVHGYLNKLEKMR